MTTEFIPPQRIPLALVQLRDKDTMDRMELNLDSVKALAQVWRDNPDSQNPWLDVIGCKDTQDPIQLFYDGDLYHIGGGHHRLAAAEMAKREFVKVQVSDGTKRDAIDYALQSPNYMHGTSLTLRDHKNRILKCIALHPDWGNVKVARFLHLSDTWVGTVRDKVSDAAVAKIQKRAAEVAAEPPKIAPGSEDDGQEEIKAKETQAALASGVRAAASRIERKKKAPSVKADGAKVTDVAGEYGKQVAHRQSSLTAIDAEIKKHVSALVKLIDDRLHTMDGSDDDDSQRAHDMCLAGMNGVILEWERWRNATR